MLSFAVVTVLKVSLQIVRLFVFLSAGERKEDHRKYEVAGEGKDDTDGGAPFARRWGTRLFGESVLQLC